MKNKFHYSRKELTEALSAIGLKRGDIVFSHSNIGFFGRPQGAGNQNECSQLILDSIFDVIGPNGTLVVPTFTYSFQNNNVFDHNHSPSACGVFTEYVRRQPECVRSIDASVSVAAMGHFAQEMVMNVPENSYGPDSFFHRFHRADGVICNLNFDAGSTFVHYVERCLDVPYRFDKTFEGAIRRSGIETPDKSTLWVRHLDWTDSTGKAINTATRFEEFDSLARSAGVYQTHSVGRGFAGLIRSNDAYRLIEDTLKERPLFLTAGEEDVLKKAS